MTEAERARIKALSEDIPALWDAESTTNADRKEIIRCLVDQVVVRVHGNTEYCDITIHWKGGYTSQHEVGPTGAEPGVVAGSQQASETSHGVIWP